MDKKKKSLDGAKVLTGMVEAMDRQFKKTDRVKSESEKETESVLVNSLRRRLAEAKTERERARILAKLDHATR